ncbi:MAG: C1 family peptidase [Zavarzinella sp.]
MNGNWTAYVPGGNTKTAAVNKIWKPKDNYRRFDKQFYVELWNKDFGFVGSATVDANTPEGRRGFLISKGGQKYQLVLVKENLPGPVTVITDRATKARAPVPESSSLYGRGTEAIPSTLPVMQQSGNSCVAWSITSVLGMQMINSNQILQSGVRGFDRKAFTKAGMNLLDAKWFYDQRPDKTKDAGWNIPDALQKAKQVVIPFATNANYGVKVVDTEWVRNDPNYIRYLLSRDVPLVGSYSFTQELLDFSGTEVFAGSVNENIINGGFGHAVALIGYNNPQAGNKTGQPYWEIQNSWGTSFARNGYFLVKPGTMPDFEGSLYRIVSAKYCKADGTEISQAEANKVLTEILTKNAPATVVNYDLTYKNLTSGNKYAESVDQIAVAMAFNQTNKVGIQLKTPSNITWWKAIKIYQDGKLIKELSTKDQTKDSGVYNFLANDNSKYVIEFWKAKTFGAPTKIKSHTIDMVGLTGRTVSFTWNKD